MEWIAKDLIKIRIMRSNDKDDWRRGVAGKIINFWERMVELSVQILYRVSPKSVLMACL